MAIAEGAVGGHHRYTVVTGGPFHRVLVGIGLTGPWRPSVIKPALAGIAITCVPLFLLGVTEYWRWGRFDPLLTDTSVVVRFFVAIPLLFAAEFSLHERCGRTLERMVHADVLGPENEPAIERILMRARRLRDRRSVEWVLVLMAVGLSLSTLFGWIGPSGLMHAGVRETLITPVRVWYCAVSLPLFQFLLARWLWHWLIWSFVLLALSRLRLQAIATHPDHAGGLAMLSDPTFSFALFAAAVSAVVAGEWTMQIVADHYELKQLIVPFAMLATTALALAFGPLLLLYPQLLGARYEGMRDYGWLSLGHARLFHRRWIKPSLDETLLGHPDISSLADLSTAYENMAKMRLVPFGPRAVITVSIGVIAPMMPLIFLEMPLDELLLKLGHALFVGLPA